MSWLHIKDQLTLTNFFLTDIVFRVLDGVLEDEFVQP
jgi:hypothetical protein